MKTALIPGTFDPVTKGHMALIRTAAALFDHVIVCILINPGKISLFDENTRLSMLRAATKSLSNVTIAADHGMTADFASRMGVNVIVRGIRNADDASYELEMASFNRQRCGIPTLLLPTDTALADVSSTEARRRISKGVSLSDIVPDEILPWIRSKYSPS